MLYLDDSGKTDPRHNSRFVVYAGISFNHTEWGVLHRRITGAKARFFRGRGPPNEWELKAGDFLTRNAWQRKKNRDFSYELVDILRRSSCSVYAVAARKASATRRLDETWLVPLIYQRIIEKFLDEINQTADIPGLIVCDWTSYKLDHHISACVQSYAVSRGYSELVGGVAYGSSRSFTAIQAADLIAGAFRRWHEGAAFLDPLIRNLTAIQYTRAAYVAGFPMRSIFRLF